MQAIQHTRYGSPDTLQRVETDKPIPANNEILVKIHATAINYADYATLTGKPFFIRFLAGVPQPKQTILGNAVTGTIEALGENVTQFSTGDAVLVDASGTKANGLAEYMVVPQETAVLKPGNLSFEDAACLPIAAVTALNALRDVGKLQSGERVLINGASGGVGFFLIQLAKYFGADVTAIVSTRNIETAKSLGADHIIDYTQNDFLQSDEKYDLVIAANGDQSIWEYKSLLTPTGRYVCSGGSMRQIFSSMIIGAMISRKNGQKLTNVYSAPNQQDLELVTELMGQGILRTVIDQCFPLENTADAFQYVLDGHATGRVIITTT